MRAASKENDKGIGNLNRNVSSPDRMSVGSGGSGRFRHRAVEKLARVSNGTACSPVREEDDDEQFGVSLKDLNREHQKSIRAEETSALQRRQSYAAQQRKMSIGGARGGARNVRKSLGGMNDTVARDITLMEEELKKINRTNQTRQNRLNEMEIAKIEVEKRNAALKQKLADSKKERDELSKTVDVLKKKLRHVEVALRRSEEKEKASEKTVTQLLTKLRCDGLKPTKKKQVSAAPKQVDDDAASGSGALNSSTCSSAVLSRKGSVASIVTKGSAAGTCAAEDEEEEEFADGADAIAAMKRPPMDVAASEADIRRYTMAPGEASRISTKFAGAAVPAVKESHTVRVGGLAKGSMSKDLYEMCIVFGRIKSARVTKCAITGDLRGYVMFAEPVQARNATRELRNKGYTALRVDDF